MKLHLGSELVKLHLGRQSCKICPITNSSVTISQFPYYQDQQEILLAYDTSILITANGDKTDPHLSNTGFSFDADCDFEIINNNAHWGGASLYGELLVDSEDTTIYFYAINLYNEQGYQDPEAGIQGHPEHEALYIQQHGTYLGSIQLTPEGYWQITKG